MSANKKDDQRHFCATPSQKYEVDEEDPAKNPEKEEREVEGKLLKYAVLKESKHDDTWITASHAAVDEIEWKLRNQH